MPSIQAAFNWSVQKCNEPNIGYSRDYREQQTVDGVTYYDCSSFIFYALLAGGWTLTPPPFTTDYMPTVLLAQGFTEVDINGLWVPGDIVYRPAGYQGHSYGHCEFVYSGSVGYGITMGAHTASYSLDRQVSINENPSYASTYQKLYRYMGGAVTREWIRDPTHYAYFTEEQMNNNALCLRDWFVTNTDWTLQAIAALAGNMRGESTINPDSIESPNYPIGTVGKDGIGLVQWTTDTAQVGNPLFVFLDYKYGNHNDWGDPVKQMVVISEVEYGVANGTISNVFVVDGYSYYVTPWIQRENMTFEEFAHSTADPGMLATVFEMNYERPATHHPEREGWARDYYQLFIDNPYTPTPLPTRKSGLKIWMMIKYHI